MCRMAALPFDVPAALRARARLGPTWARWLEALPRRTAEVADELGVAWDLAPGAAAWCGRTALVVPVRTRDGVPAVLKVGFDGDDESAHEALALQHWAGRGAVRLLAAQPRRRALLLERLTRRDLGSLDDEAACEVVAALWRELDRPAPPQLQPVTGFVDRWSAGLRALPRDAPVPRRLVEQWLATLRDLVAHEHAARGGARIVHGDLHHANVLAAAGGGWRAIDPKPMAGDAHYEPAPMLWNRWEELAAAPGGVRRGVRRRFHGLVDAGGLDEARARAWVLVRLVLNAYWTIEDAERAGRALSASDRDWITRCVTIVKAVHD